MQMVLLLLDQMSNQYKPLQSVRMNDLICWSHIDNNVADNVDDLTFWLFAEFNACEFKQPLQVPLNIHFG